jgi:alpha-D-ribose 1-methylphosphonate 5-triphosphate synthase subunit PhnL
LKIHIKLLNTSYSWDIIIKINLNIEKGTNSYLKYFNNGIGIKTLSLKTLLSDYQIDKTAIKMNYEGYGYNLFLDDNDTLKELKSTINTIIKNQSKNLKK